MAGPRREVSRTQWPGRARSSLRRAPFSFRPGGPLFHLALASEWRAGWRDGRYTPARFAADGFVHCCDDEATTLQVAAAYFSRAKEDVIVAEVDEAALDVDVRREAPAPPDGKAHAHHHPGKTFPHVYGSVPATAVTRIGPLKKHPDGTWGWPTEWAYGKPAP